jgi:hypothetical protein
MAEKIIKDLRTLKSMERAGFIKLHEDTGKSVSWQGRSGKVYYVDDGKREFTFKGKNYETKYYSGSFFPYVVQQE